jgi:hypothetical protein
MLPTLILEALPHDVAIYGVLYQSTARATGNSGWMARLGRHLHLS